MRFWKFRSRFRNTATTQPVFRFRERLDRTDWWFKRGILLATSLAVVGLVGGSASGRFAVGWLARRAKWAAVAPLGLEPSREEIDADWRSKRELSMLRTRQVFQKVYDRAAPHYRELLRVAGMAPDQAVFRWGNYDRSLLLSSKVFDPDDNGRSYRLKPNTRSIWLRQITVEDGVHGLFLVPDTAEMRKLVGPNRSLIVEESVQTTNSWGCRGAEPDLSAPMRGLVLGDSYMQGLYVGNDDAPPARLERYLREAWHMPVSILNTGHLGYSPEQYYYTLRAYCERFHPHFVVVGVFANDFGDTFGVLRGQGDWAEADYWIGEIVQYCRTRNIPFLMSPIPLEIQISGRRDADSYPGQFSRMCRFSSYFYVDPIEDFVNEHIRLTDEGARRGHRPATSPLFNGHVGDGHLSPRGSELWAHAVGQRIALLIQPRQTSSAPARPAAPPPHPTSQPAGPS